MLTRAVPLLVLLVSLLLLPGCDQHAEDKAEIREVFANVEIFNNQKRGTEILEIFSSNTFEEYEHVLKIALDGKPEQVRQLGPGNRLEVFRIRTLAKRSQVEKWNPRSYCEYATSAGWYVRPPEERFQENLGNIAIKGDEAFAEYFAEKQRVPVRLRFVREGGRWRYDEPYAFEQWDRFWYENAKELGMPIDEFLVEELEHQLEQPVSLDAIWKPMRK